jgi:hypothetical protein
MRAWIPIFLIAVVVRGLLLASWMVPDRLLLAGYHIEAEAVARSLVRGDGYADPYGIPTGPTAHPVPVHTGLQALLFLLFGDTLAAGYARAIAGIVACAALYATLPWLAERLGLGRRAGIVAGLAAAIVPWQGSGEVLGWLSGDALAAMALGALAVMFARRSSAPERVTDVGSIALGAFAGVAFHQAPALLPVVAGCVAFELWWTRSAGKWKQALVLTLGALVVCLPWAWRNYRALGDLFFIRSNFGLELHLGNHDGARADVWTTDVHRLHPGNTVDEALRVRSLGEAAYMRAKRAEALGWIRAHPGPFAALTAGRVWHVWFGPPARPLEAILVSALTLLALAGLWRARSSLSVPQRAAIVVPLLAFPLIFYLVGYVPRYTFPLYGLLLVLAGRAVVPGDSNRRQVKSAGESSGRD